MDSEAKGAINVEVIDTDRLETIDKLADAILILARALGAPPRVEIVGNVVTTPQQQPGIVVKGDRKKTKGRKP